MEKRLHDTSGVVAEKENVVPCPARNDNATTRRTMPVPTLDGTKTIGAVMRNDQVIMGIADEWLEKFGAVPFNKRHGRFPFTWRVMRRLAELEHIGQADLKEGPLFHSVAQTFRNILSLERPTVHSCSGGVQGEPTSRSAEKVAEYRKTDAYREVRAINNAITNAKTKTRHEEERVERILKNPDMAQHLLSGTELDAKVTDLLDVPRAELALSDEHPASRTLKEAAKEFTHCIYFGKTYRTLEAEGLRWLTQRGINRPVLTWPNGSNITMRQAVEVLGFQMIEVACEKLSHNASGIEDRSQQWLEGVHDRRILGLQLHRHVAKGKKNEKVDYDAETFNELVFATVARITSHNFNLEATNPNRWILELNGHKVKIVR